MHRQLIARGLAIALLGALATFSPGDKARAAVGSTEAAYGVTQNGAVSYSIPIRVTDGIAGLTPDLAISYAGPGTRTILGVGFTLSGFSYITPCRKTIAQDLNAAPVTLTSTDRYCLDGARLRLVTGTYGASNATYRTELDQMVRVTSLNSTNGIPGSFKVEMPNGLEYEFGNTIDSKLLASATSGAPPQFWAVNKISDGSGNSMSFVYDTNNSTRRFRPSTIDYTESSAGAAKYRVTFVYLTPITNTLLFTPSLNGGAARSDDKLLEVIELSHEGSVYRTIDLDYETTVNGDKRLQSVKECAPTVLDDCLPPTTIGWQSATAGHATTPTTSSGVAGGPIPLDINNDGFEDLVWAASGTWRYMLGSATGYGSILNTGITATNASKAMPLEWNADGFWDLLIDWSDNKWRVLKGSATGFQAPVHAGPGSGIPSNAANTSWTVADADNDGRDDLFSMQLNALLAINVRLNSATGFGALTEAYGDPELHVPGNKGFIRMGGASAIRRPDFNGDGRTDLLVYACYWDMEPPTHCITSNRWFQLMSNGSSYVNVGTLPNATFAIDARYADFNADGMTDLAYPASTGAWMVGYGQGSGSLAFANGPSSGNYATYQTLTGDYNGDGYDDLYATRNSDWKWEVFLSTGTALETTATISNVSGTGTSWILADQNGDSLPDLGRHDSTGLTWGSFAHLGLPGDRLLSSVDGLGNSVTFSYLPMTDSAVYSRGTGAIYPSRDLQNSTPLARTMQIAPAGGQSFTLSYKYKQARVHAQGRSFLGMATREISDSRSTIFATETYRQDYPFIGAPATVSVKQSSAPSANTIQGITHVYSYHVLSPTPGNERYLPYRLGTVTDAYEVGGVKNGAHITQIAETHTVNTSGNSTLVAIDVKDKDLLSPETGSVYRTEVTSTYSEDTTNWCIALPLTRSEKRILPNSTSETRVVAWQVEATQCRVTKETIEPGSSNSAISLITDLTYDGCGNVNSISSFPVNQPTLARTTSINYGSRCQRPESITNPENHTSTIAYNWPLAAPSSHTDPNGISTSLIQDGFGRLTQRNNPDGTDVTFTLTACTAGNSWCGKNSAARIKISQAMRDTSNATIRTDEQFLDGFGRVHWSHSDSLESGPSIVQSDYDAFGRPSASSQPHFAGGTVYATLYTRDLIGRVTRVNAPISEADPSGRITDFAFEGRDLKVTDPKIIVTTRRSNVIGQLRAVIDPSPGGTTSYSYHPFGELASIQDAASNITSWAYNVRGFATSTTDPDSGTWTYESNAFGETERIRDANTAPPAWSTQFTFDELSRPKTRVDLQPAGTTYFNWGTSAAAKNIGQLESVSSPGGYAEGYSFDSLGRLSQQSITADGTTYYVDLTYLAASGQLGTLEYPTSTSGYRLKLGYEYANGLLKRVKHISGAPVYWEAVSTDAWGNFQDESFGNGVDTFTNFDQASGLMMAREGGVGGGTGLIHAQVDWDLNNNLKQRKDLKLSPAVTEDFFYDNLNRFDRSERSAGGSPAINTDVTLDAIGNILWKKDVCPTGANCYTYHATQKRAVTAAGSFSFGYDNNGNMTTRNGSSISYTSYNLASVINAGAGTSSTLSYGAFRNRYKQVAVAPGTTETTIYVGGLLEKVTRGGSTEYRHLVHGGQGVAAIYTRISGGTNSTYYVHRDHLGSPELITDSSGQEVVRPSFGAYGERRDGTDWSGPPSAADLADIASTTRRGFTGHEHLDAVALIHMNGRVYEPVAGRFLGVDPILNIGLSQDVNSYSYAWNNPLNVTDPSGLYDQDVTKKLCKSDCYTGSFMDYLGIMWGFEAREQTIEEKRSWQFLKPGDVVDTFAPNANWDGNGSFDGQVKFGADAVRTEGGADPNLPNSAWLRFKLWWYTPKTIPWCGYNCAKVDGVETQIATTNGGDLMNAVGALSIAAGPLSAAGSASANAARGTPVIVGENMARVEAYASRIGGEFFQGQGMAANQAWIQAARDAGRQIIDIGPDFARRLTRLMNGQRIDSIFYNMERGVIRGYENVQTVWRRAGKFWGELVGGY